MNSPKYLKIPLNRCDPGDHSYELFSDEFFYPLGPKTGIINTPVFPLLLQTRGDSYRILYGFRFFEHYRELALDECPAVVFPETLSELQIISVVIRTQKYYGLFYPIDIARVLHFVRSRAVAEEEIISAVLPEFEIAPNAKVLHQYLSLKAVPSFLIDFLIQKNAPLKTWLQAADCVPDAQTFFRQLIGIIRPSLSNFKEIARNLQEIALRDKITVPDLIHQLELESSVNRETEPARILANIRQILMRRRYPLLSEYRDAIENRIAQLELPGGATLHYDKSFEKKALRLEFRIESVNDVEHLQKQLTDDLFVQLKELFQSL